MGIASKLRSKVIDQVELEYPMGAVIFACHMDRNEGITKSSKKLSFIRTGVRSDIDPDTASEYWVKSVGADYFKKSISSRPIVKGSG
jgi:hypothetical protein